MAQQAGRTYRLGCLFPSPRDLPRNVAFFAELRRHGFMEGQNLKVEYRAYGQHVDLITQYATELIMARVDVIAAAGDEAVRAVQQATKTIPIVALGTDMLGAERTLTPVVLPSGRAREVISPRFCSRLVLAGSIPCTSASCASAQSLRAA
jgi:putative ABC transport system substrate-binding protein